MRNIIVFDVDGVLLDCTHRLHYIAGEKKDWDKFFSCGEMRNDGEGRYFAMFTEMHHFGRVQVTDARICTARPESTRLITANSLQLSMSERIMLMRSDGDYRPDYVVKKEMLDEIGKERILFWIDDSPAVCEMLRVEGVDVLQVGDRKK